MSNLQVILGEALSTALLTEEVAVVSRWVVLAETVDMAGERGLWAIAAEGMKSWDTVGLLTHALHLEQAALGEGME